MKKRATSVPRSQHALTLREFFSTKYIKRNSLKTEGDADNHDYENKFYNSRAVYSISFFAFSAPVVRHLINKPAVFGG